MALTIGLRFGSQTRAWLEIPALLLTRNLRQVISLLCALFLLQKKTTVSWGVRVKGGSVGKALGNGGGRSPAVLTTALVSTSWIIGEPGGRHRMRVAFTSVSLDLISSFPFLFRPGAFLECYSGCV